MKDRDARQVEHEARRDIAAHPQRAADHGEQVRRFVGSILYAELKEEHGQPTDERGEEEPPKGRERR